MILDIARFALRRALEKGADEVEVYTGSRRELSVTFERNDVNIGKGHDMSGAAIRVFKNKSLGFASVNSFERSEVDLAVDRALKLASTSPRDEFNELPDMKPLKKVLGLYDKESEHFTSEQALEYAGKMFGTAKDFDPRITIDSCAFIADIGQHGVMNSSGIECYEKYSDFIYYVSGMARDGEEVSNMDYMFDGTHLIKEIECEKLATEFAERVVKTLGAKKIESFKGTVLLSPFTCTDLIGSIVAHSCDSNNVQKGSSRFMGKMGQEVASETLTVKDDGTIPGGLGSSSFDREGLPHSPLTLIDRGVLAGFMHNTYTANKEGVSSTAHATGDTRSLPEIEPTNLMIEPGAESWEAIVSDIKKGVLVNRFSGFPQMISGDISGIVKGGWLIENGELVRPVIETMIAGNIFELLKKASQVSKERKKIMNFIMPYVRIDGVSVTGG